MLRYLALLCNIPQFFEMFSKAKIQIILHILMPLLITTENEKEDIIENPTEYVNYISDLTHQQVSYLYPVLTPARNLIPSKPVL